MNYKEIDEKNIVDLEKIMPNLREIEDKLIRDLIVSSSPTLTHDDEPTILTLENIENFMKEMENE